MFECLYHLKKIQFGDACVKTKRIMQTAEFTSRNQDRHTKRKKKVNTRRKSLKKKDQNTEEKTEINDSQPYRTAERKLESK